jgi:hypothetical protein
MYFTDGHAITIPLMVLACVQFPVYGLFVDIASRSIRLGQAIFLVALFHAVAVLLCFRIG